ncbi:MAG: PEP-CTERM sorting domain-containing protein [Verrucomicrobiota bacterium]
MRKNIIKLFGSVALLACASATHAQIITNGDFETGDFTGWTVAGAAITAETTTPIAGTTSAAFPGGFGGNSLTQTFADITDDFTFSMDYTSAAPAAGRSLNVYIGQNGGGNPRINLRLIDGGGTGTIQAFNGAWQDVLTGISFAGTQTLTVDVSNIGASTQYTVDVGGSTSAAVSFFQTSTPLSFGTVSLQNADQAWGADNVSLTVVPEPSTFALLIAGFAGLFFVKRRRK